MKQKKKFRSIAEWTAHFLPATAEAERRAKMTLEEQILEDILQAVGIKKTQ